MTPSLSGALSGASAQRAPDARNRQGAGRDVSVAVVSVHHVHEPGRSAATAVAPVHPMHTGDELIGRSARYVHLMHDASAHQHDGSANLHGASASLHDMQGVDR